MANAPYIVNQFKDRLNVPTSVDYKSALQGFTGPNAHPLEIFEEFRKMGVARGYAIDPTSQTHVNAAPQRRNR